MCNIDRLKLLQSPLNIDGAFSMVWKKINKCIDSLHINNHKRPECRELYNPEKVRETYPEANLMTCEQVFCWMGIGEIQENTQFHTQNSFPFSSSPSSYWEEQIY